MAHWVEFCIEKGPRAGTVHTFKEHDTFIFGRMEDCHVCLPDDLLVSRHHFIAEVSPPHVNLRDLGSRNGTWVNGRKTGGRAAGETPEQGAARDYPLVEILDGAKIQVGETDIRVRVKGTAEPPVIKRDAALANPSEMAPAELAAALFGGAGARKAFEVPGYTIEKEIGRGGFGAVFAARHNRSGARVAVKIMIPQADSDANAVQRFLREVSISAKLKHPRIVPVLASGQEGDLFYFVMPYIAGGNAASAVAAAKGALSLERTLEIALPALAGLVHAHGSGVVHRDLKPQNILLDNAGGMLADFGLSKSFQGAGLSGLTLTKSVSGTAVFMPREQVTNFKYVRPVSDVWSMAASIYFMLTGKFVYEFSPRRNPLDVILNEAPVPIRKRSAGIPKKVADVLDHALLADAKKRIGTAKLLLDGLQSAR